jgi:stress-induced morphogen
MPATKEDLIEILNKNFPNSEIEIKALTNDNDHWEVCLKFSDFAGKSRIDQHRMVSNALTHLNIHALSIKTSTT